MPANRHIINGEQNYDREKTFSFKFIASKRAHNKNKTEFKTILGKIKKALAYVTDVR